MICGVEGPCVCSLNRTHPDAGIDNTEIQKSAEICPPLELPHSTHPVLEQASRHKSRLRRFVSGQRLQPCLSANSRPTRPWGATTTVGSLGHEGGFGGFSLTL